MKQLSSKSTFVSKRLLPIAWFVLWGLGLAVGVLTVGKEPLLETSLIAIIGPCLALVGGFVMFRLLLWDIADEVIDGGDFLLVRQRGHEERVPFSNIMNVSVTTMVNPVRITLRLVTPNRFGPEIVFTPRMSFSLNPFAKNPVAEDLMLRSHAARSRRGR